MEKSKQGDFLCHILITSPTSHLSVLMDFISPHFPQKISKRCKITLQKILKRCKIHFPFAFFPTITYFCITKKHYIMNTAALRLEPSVPFSDIKTSIVEKIWNLNNIDLLSSINNLLGKERPQEPELKPYTMEEIYAEIDESLADYETGRVLSTEQVDQMMRDKYKWLR